MANPKQPKRNYNPWTEQEKTILKTAVQNNSINGRVNWMTVQQYLPHRTKQQCKSIFMNLIKMQELSEEKNEGKSNSSQHEQETTNSGQETQYSEQMLSKSQSDELREQQLNSKYNKFLSKHEQGTIYFLSRYYKFDWKTVAQHYNDYTPEEIQDIHARSHKQYTQFFSALRAFQYWDQTSVLNVRLQDAKEVYNEVVISLTKLDHIGKQFNLHNNDANSQNQIATNPQKIQVSLFEGETFQSLEYDFFDQYIIQRINEKYNLAKVYHNVFKWLEDNNVAIPSSHIDTYQSDNQIGTLSDKIEDVK